jgi:hypothetical protein
MGVPDGLVGVVQSVTACPPIQKGPGRVVLATVSHLNEDLYTLTLENASGATETIGVTGYHPFYDESTGWTEVQNLHVGEALRGANGDLTVMSVSRNPGTDRVYNMTVEADHVYYVGDLPALVHNSCPVDPIEQHHLLPKEFEEEFNAVGLDIEDFTMPLPRSQHRLNPNGIHTNAGGNWNGVWRAFFDTHPTYTADDVLQQLARMMHDFGL